MLDNLENARQSRKCQKFLDNDSRKFWTIPDNSKRSRKC